ncbi:MAG: MATE family efflux transporter [Spirochaetaceae bacterium]|jgi:putative MATE family efflux protein|nr:MATE family efflux transporter [Spirochaetaceae bacterium]
MKQDKFTLMTETPVEALVCRLSVPSIIIMLISSLYNMADTYFVGSLGTSAVAAVGVVFPLMAVIQALGFLFGQGSGNYISRALGAKHTEKAAKMAATGFFSALILGALLSGLGLIYAVPLASALGATPTILPYAAEYMRFILIGMPWMAGSLTLNNQLRFQGSSFYGMIGMLSGAVLNMILDPLCIFVLGLGIKGASLATMISQGVGCSVLFAGSFRNGNIGVRASNFSPSRSHYREILRGGIPSLLRQGLMSAMTIVINRFAAVYGDAALAAISIVNRVCMFANSAVLGVGQGFQPVCGFNYGAKRYDRVRQAFWFCVRLVSAGLTLICIILAVFAPQIIALFRKGDPAVISIGARSLRLQCIGLPFTSWQVLCNMMVQTMGKSLQASFLALSRQGLFLLPFLLLFTPFWGLLGIQISPMASNIASFFVAVPLGIKILREMKETP